MKKITLLLLLVSSFFSYAQERAIRNNVIVFDITGSMVGKPTGSGNADIWKLSLDLLEKQLSSFLDGSDEKITIYLFGESLIKLDKYTADFDKEKIDEILKSISSYRDENKMQSYTCIYKSLQSVIEDLSKNEVNTIYLFTDGRNSDNYRGCDAVTSLDLINKWEEASKDNDLLYIFKLKSFNLPQNLSESAKIQVVNDALHNYIVDIEPLNKNIKIGKSSQISSQKFRITGAGKSYLQENIIIITPDFALKSKNNTENAEIDKGLEVVDKVQSFQVNFFNQIQNIPEEIYQGKLDYTFKSGKKVKILKGKQNIRLSIKNAECLVLFDNKDEKPKVSIEYVE